MLSLREVMAISSERADFWLPNFGFKISLLGLLKFYATLFVVSLNFRRSFSSVYTREKFSTMLEHLDRN